MDLTLRIPDDLACRFNKQSELARPALEALVLDEYRAGHLMRPELRRLRGFETCAEPDAFLKGCGGDESMTATELDRERQNLDGFGV